MNKKFFLPLLTSLLLLQAQPVLSFQGLGSDGGGGARQQIDISGHQGNSNAVVATINGTEVHLGKLMNAMMKIYSKGGYSQDELSAELASRIRYQALEELALEELAFQRGVALGITIDPAVVEKNVQAAISAEGGLEALETALSKKSQTLDDLRQEIISILTVKKAVAVEVDQKVNVSPELIEEVYLKNRHQFISPEKVIVTDIIFFLEPDDPASTKTVLQLKEKIIKELSNDPTRLTPQGFIVSPNLNVSPQVKPQLYKTAKQMDVGSLSDPFIVDGTLHLIKLDYIQPSTEKPAEEAKKIIAGKLKADMRQELLKQWRESLQKEAKIEIVHDLMNPQQ